MSDPIDPRPLSFLHIGDLHMTDAGLQNHLDLRRIVDEVNGHALNQIDFVYLPGDNADDGTPEQFRIVGDEMSRLKLPWFAIPGDHDFKPKSLDNFYRSLNARQLPFAAEIAGCRCVFLDVVSQGTGGPDFRLGSSQMAWLRDQLDRSRRDGENVVVFMHAYPADLGGEAGELAAMFDEGRSRWSIPATPTTMKSSMMGARSTPRRVRPARSRRAKPGFRWSRSIAAW